MAILRLTYQPNNNMVDGMGALMVGPGTLKVAKAVARKYLGFLAVSMAVAEADAAGEELPPGRITELFSKAHVQNDMALLVEDGHANWRRAAKVTVTGAYEGKDKATGFPKSSPVTIEFGSHYNEGTRGDRPDFRVMANALRAQSLVTKGMNLAKDWTDKAGHHL